MVLSARDLGIREGLDPFFCSDCGNRIGWCQDASTIDPYVFCEDCAKKEKEED